MTVGTVLRRRGSADPHRFSHPMVWQVLQEADVLCMQEVWRTDATKLFDALGHGHKVRDDSGWRLRPFSAGGSGLGMSIAHGIVREHEGQMEVQSREGKGTTVMIDLPVEAPSHQRVTDGNQGQIESVEKFDRRR